MDATKLLGLAAKFKDVPGIIVQAGIVAGELAALAELIADNHNRAKAVLSEADQVELDMIHAETLALIDAFDAELGKAAAR